MGRDPYGRMEFSVYGSGRTLAGISRSKHQLVPLAKTTTAKTSAIKSKGLHILYIVI